MGQIVGFVLYLVFLFLLFIWCFKKIFKFYKNYDIAYFKFIIENGFQLQQVKQLIQENNYYKKREHILWGDLNVIIEHERWREWL